MEPKLVYLPRPYVDTAAPFAIDVGGSLVKIAYKPNQEYPAKEGLGAVCIATLPPGPTAPGKVVELLRRHADLAGLRAGETVITTTGVGAGEIGTRLQEVFHVKCQPALEFDCNIVAFHLLHGKLAHDELFHQVPDHLVLSTAQLVRDYTCYVLKNYKNQIVKRGVNEPVPGEALAALTGLDVPNTPVAVLDRVLGLRIAPPQEIYPAMVVTVGSGVSFLKVSENGTYKMTDMSNRAGTSFLGLGRVITGAKDFDELIALAEKGDTRNVDVMAADYMKPGQDPEKNVYSGMPADVTFYCFGKAMQQDRESFCREDLAAGLLNFLVMDLVQSSVGCALALDCKSIILAGSFVENELVRAQMMRRTMLCNGMFKEKRLPFLFLRNGSHLGALGAIIGADDPHNKVTGQQSEGATK